MHERQQQQQQRQEQKRQWKQPITNAPWAARLQAQLFLDLLALCICPAKESGNKRSQCTNLHNGDTSGIVADGVAAVANSAADLYGDPIMTDLWQIETLSSMCRLNACAVADVRAAVASGVVQLPLSTLLTVARP